MDSSKNIISIAPAISGGRMADEDWIYRELEQIGRRIAQIAEPIAHQGGDHDYDGAMEHVWEGLHHALGHDGEGCSLHGGPTGYCTANARPLERTPKPQRIPNATRTRVLKRDGHKCRTCGTEEGLNVYRIVPFSRGGGIEDDNLGLFCAPCGRKAQR